MYNFKEKKRFFDNLMNVEAAEADLKLLVAAAPGNSNLSTYKRNPRRYAGDILYTLLDFRSADDIRLNRRKHQEKSGEGGEPTAPVVVPVPETQKEDKPAASEVEQTEKSGEDGEPTAPAAAPVPETQKEDKPVASEAEQTEKSGEEGEFTAPVVVPVPETQKEDKPIVSEAPKPAKNCEKKTKTQPKGKSKSTKSIRK